MKFIGTIVICFLLCTYPAYAQDSTQVFKKRKTILFASSAAAYTGSMIVLNNVWYSQYERQPFQFFNDAAEWHQMDKLGHTYSAFHITSGYSRIIQWSGVDEKKSDRIAALTSFGVMASIEVLDGFSEGYGASVSDLVANSAGIGLYWGQKALWKEVRIHPKFSFRRTDFSAMRPAVLGATLPEQILKDYNGQSQWLSFDLDKFNDRFPAWLNIAVGCGTEGMIYAHPTENQNFGLTPYRQFYLSLDFDVTALQTRSKAVKTLLFVVNMIKLPAPTLELSNKKLKGHFFYF